MMVKACSCRQFGLCRWFTYRTVFLPTMCHWHSDCHSLKDASLDLERHGEIVDFQTGGPIMSTLLLIYMYWKSNGFYQGKPFHPASSPLQVDIQSYPYDVIGSDMGLMQVCGG